MVAAVVVTFIPVAVVFTVVVDVAVAAAVVLTMQMNGAPIFHFLLRNFNKEEEQQQCTKVKL